MASPSVHGSMIKRVNILGVGVSAINMDMALETIDRWIRERTRRYVCLRDVHGLMQCQSDESLRAIHNRAGLVTPDGMPLVWLLKLSGEKQADRVYGPDLMLAVFEHGLSRNYKHFLYGTTEETLLRLRRRSDRRQRPVLPRSRQGGLSESERHTHTYRAVAPQDGAHADPETL